LDSTDFEGDPLGNPRKETISVQPAVVISG
jgi:hypothetical protein